MSTTFKVFGNWNKTFHFLSNAKRIEEIIDAALNAGGRKGVEALSMYTPKDTGLASSSWGYTIEKDSDGATITWHNYDIEGGYNVALLIQYGHGTGTGGYVPPRDFVNPALVPIFEQISAEVWEEVVNA